MMIADGDPSQVECNSCSLHEDSFVNSFGP